jgi:hypothetical protein
VLRASWEAVVALCLVGGFCSVELEAAYHISGWGVSQLALEAVECIVDVRLNDQEIWRTMMLRWEAMWDADWLQG